MAILSPTSVAGLRNWLAGMCRWQCGGGVAVKDVALRNFRTGGEEVAICRLQRSGSGAAAELRRKEEKRGRSAHVTGLLPSGVVLNCGEYSRRCGYRTGYAICLQRRRILHLVTQICQIFVKSCWIRGRTRPVHYRSGAPRSENRSSSYVCHARALSACRPSLNNN